ncbi:MAG: MFS transporter [Chloroflexi bacterium]|nr:MFS transporter [Chloroflexota bacterium]MCY3582378.1 MFS transporter [Chloroflexota bacterium]MCY3717088.1 MFS transporter [Chloroflexota bacterium]MDE2650792.1 MFS transporter [Chloroflexota bacterium]
MPAAPAGAKNTAMSRRLPPGLNRRVLLFFCHSLLFHIALLGIADILLNFYLVSIGFDGQTIALLQSLPRLSGFLIGLPIGLWADRIGNRRLIALSTAGIALSVAATALTTSLPWLALSRFAWGACFGANQVVKPPFMVTLTDRHEHTAQFSWHNLVSMLAVALGSALGGLLPMLLGGSAHADSNAYRASILLAALVLLLSVLPMLPLGGQGEAAGSQWRRRDWRRLPWRRLLRLTSPLFIFGISGGLTFPFFNLFFRDVFALGDSAVGAVIGLGWLVMGVLPLANPLWGARLGRAGALFSLMLVSALAFTGLSLAQALPLAVLCYALAIGARNTMQPLFQPLLMDSLRAAHHNLASSLGLALWNMGWFGATLAFGWLQLALGYRGIMLLVAAFVLLNGLSIRLTALRKD